jgi:hypothetical protein
VCDASILSSSSASSRRGVVTTSPW